MLTRRGTYGSLSVLHSTEHDCHISGDHWQFTKNKSCYIEGTCHIVRVSKVTPRQQLINLSQPATHCTPTPVGGLHASTKRETFGGIFVLNIFRKSQKLVTYSVNFGRH